uniref:PLA2c domain-containing protein n=1 Tax=Ciona savignyi TaxID=51511 RepID=H2Z901_CIOSA
IKSKLLDPLKDPDENVGGFSDPDLDPISTTDTVIALCDAGILKNVATEPVTRPQRFSELVIVVDFSKHESDSKFNYSHIVQTADHAKAQGIKFPPIDFKKLLNSPPKELLVFESHDDDCPTVLWFTLCTKEFRNLEDYKPRSSVKPPDDKAFTDFSVFGSGTSYGTLNFSYTDYQFDQLRELMHFNVTSNIEVVKTHLAKAVEKKKRRLQKYLSKI